MPEGGCVHGACALAAAAAAEEVCDLLMPIVKAVPTVSMPSMLLYSSMPVDIVLLSSVQLQ